MRFIKKITVFILLGFLFVGFSSAFYKAQATILSEETQHIYGATHQRIQRSLNTGTQSVLQTYHYLGADFQTDAFRVITGDDYTSTGFKPNTTLAHAKNAQETFDEYLVIGGVNADFFEGIGVPQEAYIRNGDILSQGIGYPARQVVGFKNDGSAVYGKPVFDGYEVIVADQNGKERIRLPIKQINSTFQENPFDIYAYFQTYTQDLKPGVNKYVLDVIETKGALPKIFGKGVVTNARVNHRLNVGVNQIVIVSHNTYLENLVQNNDIITVQAKMTGDFEGVQWAIGAYGLLVENGNKLNNIVGIDPTFRHPRSAIGIKEDGSTFFVTVDGRQAGYSQGATLYELADLMISYGAKTALNLDGGGSTTMVLNDRSENFYIANQPSQIPARTVTNSVLLALKIRFDDQNPHPIPDLSIPLDQVTVQGVNELGHLVWQTVSYRTNYEIKINDMTFFTTQATLNLKQIISEKGNYDILVKAMGDGIMFSDGPYSQPYQFVYNGAVNLIAPHKFLFTNGILYWDIENPLSRYEVKIDTRVYTINLNRINLNSLNLPPGVYDIEIKALGDQFFTLDSEISFYRYRIYSEEEAMIQETLKLFLELLYLKNKP